MTDKPYTTYRVKGASRIRWKRILLWSMVGLLVVALAAVGGSYLWLNSLVDSTHTMMP